MDYYTAAPPLTIPLVILYGIAGNVSHKALNGLHQLRSQIILLKTKLKIIPGNGVENRNN
jgi:hypothetical protein